MPEIDEVAFMECEDHTLTDPVQLALSDPECACEQSTYWARMYGANCYQENVKYCCSAAETPCGAIAKARGYHPDYLGSIEAVTDARGEVYQFFHNTICHSQAWLERGFNRSSGLARLSPVSAALREGEPLQDQRAVLYNSFTSPYRFNGKERDWESGNYYYGARYYDPKLSVWLGVDALAHKGPWISPYALSHNNPINLVDSDGNWPWGWWGVTYLFNKAQAAAGAGVGIQAVSQKGVAYDQVGVTHFHMIANYIVDATESGKTEAVGGLMGSWTYGIRQDYKNETFYGSIMEEGATFSGGAAVGVSGGIEFGDGLIGGELGFGLGFLVQNGVTEMKESISVTDAQADAINSQMGGGNGKTWSIDQETVRYNKEGGYWEANVAARTTNKVTTEVVVRSYDRKVWMSQDYLDQAIKAEFQ